MRASTRESPAVPAPRCPLASTGALMFSGESGALRIQALQPNEEHMGERRAPLALVRQAT